MHELDAAVIVFQLGLTPNMVVCESGTGSGAMSHAMVRAVAPGGRLHTYEFNKMRVEAAREDFVSNGVGHLVKVHWRDVCGKEPQQEPDNKEEIMGSGGFDLLPSTAHAIFLDLPEPWLAIPHAAETLRPNGRIASYSPCVEQSQKTCIELTECGFHTIRTMEVRLREHYVDEVAMESVPTKKLPREPHVNPFIPGLTIPQVSMKDQAAAAAAAADAKEETTVSDSNTTANYPVSDTNTDEQPKKKTKVTTPACSLPPSIPSSTPTPTPTPTPPTATTTTTTKKRKLMCARPFASIRGHTAFLTFATNGNAAFYTNKNGTTTNGGSSSAAKAKST